MCGITGYKGSKQASEIVFQGLKKLEYRGYDSWGLAAKNNDSILVQKQAGKISEAVVKKFPENHLAIAHTRWATHGSVSEKNAHPHFSQNKKIALVHNGIVENFQELKKFLTEKGFSFKSDTDTEIIPNLVEYFLSKNKNFKNAVISALQKIEGSFAVVAVNSDSNELIGAKNGSPLIVGLKDEEFFIASDVPAFLDFTKKIVFLNDNELVSINSQPEFFNIENGKKILKKTETISWSLEQAKKGSFSTFMLKEINEHPQAIRQAAEQDPVKMKKVANLLKNSDKIFLTGCGSSYHACLSGQDWFSKLARKHVNVVLSSEFKNFQNFVNSKTVVVAVSQSGETADVLDAVKRARLKNAKIVSIVNVQGSTLTRLSDETIMLNSGPEICVLSTKTYSAQLTVLMLLASFLGQKQDEIKKLIQKTVSFIPDLVKDFNTKAEQLAQKIASQKNIFVIGRNTMFASALEAALKIKEVSYIHAEGFAGGELKHGTIALIEKNVPAFILSTNNSRKEILSNAMEIKSRGGMIIGLDSEENDLFDFFFKVPDVNFANPVLMAIPLQLVSYHLALKKNLDPDKPRNLAKSVTVK